MKKTTPLLTTVAAVSLFAMAACSFERGTNPLTAPSNVTVPANTVQVTPAPAPPASGSYLGTWTSQGAIIPTTGSCGNLQWTVTSQTATSLTGNFSAQCAGGITGSGTASGQLITSTTASITVTGTASMPNIPQCNFSLNGIGTLVDNGDTLQVPFTGTTCLGPVQGTEVLRRPSPPPLPSPPPPPPPPPSANPNHISPGPLTADRARQVVFATGNEFPNLTAAKNSNGESLASAEELLRRMIWHLQLAGFQAGRQRNPSGAISSDKLTVVADGTWRVFDCFYDLGTAGLPTRVQFVETSPANSLSDPGISD